MRRYETIYILRPTMSEDEVNEVIENTNAVLSTGDGEIISLDKWGLRTLAYLIKKETQGYYVFCDYGTDSANVTEMERKFRIDESVMKYMTVKIADSISSEGIAAARGEYEAAIVAAAKAEEEAEEQKQEEQKKSEKPVTDDKKTADDTKSSDDKKTTDDKKSSDDKKTTD